MDEFLEQMLSASSWDRGSWDATAVSSANGMAVDSIGVMQGLPKISTMPLMPSSRLVGTLEDPGLRAHSRAPQEGNGVGESAQYPSNKPALSPQFEHRDTLFDATQTQHQESSHLSLQRLGEGAATGGPVVLQLNTSSSQALPPIGGPSRGPATLSGSPLLKSNGFEGSGFQQQVSHNLQSSPLIAPTWRQPYIGGVPPLPSALGQGKPDTFALRGEGVSSEAHLGKRSRDDEDILREDRPGNMSHVGPSQGLQSGQGYGEQSPLGQNPSAAGVNGAGRPRVRARRGQATDPHSIAERNRRERIAERMKALQELVPDSNKTDKASMLDEIIGYVKFLQMQVKCLSMCRLGGAGAAAPLFDLPAEGAGNFVAANLAQANGAPGSSQDGMAFAERQVARLMDEDMSAAMQYLQSKGLCLMPISLATAISSTGARQPSAPAKGVEGGGNEKQAMELQVVAATGSTSPAVMATLAGSGAGALANDGITKAGGSVPKNLKDLTRDDNGNEKTTGASLGLSSSTSKGGVKNRDDSQR